MNSLTCIIVDNIEQSKKLKRLLYKVTGIKILAIIEDPELAVEKIVNLEPDIVFCEMKLPQKSGFELARKILERKKRTCFIFLSEYNESVIKTLRNGAYEYLIKPITLERLTKVLEDLKRDHLIPHWPSKQFEK